MTGGGALAGVREGWECEIRRGDLRIGRAQVKLVKQELSGAQVLQMKDGQEVKAGDVAVFGQ